jgi:hypothetical protein
MPLPLLLPLPGVSPPNASRLSISQETRAREERRRRGAGAEVVVALRRLASANARVLRLQVTQQEPAVGGELLLLVVLVAARGARARARPSACGGLKAPSVFFYYLNTY